VDPKDVDPVGTWSFTAPTAPEGYGSGDIQVTKAEAQYKVTLKFGEYAIQGMSVKYDKNVLTFQVFLEGEYININATFTNEGVKGSASYSEGQVDFTAKKKVVKK
jgi:hypothetical protein